MLPKKQALDIVNTVLEDCIMAFPVSSFIISLYKQYMQRGSLSKKQLIGLHAKASDIKDYPPGKLATLQALINRMPNRFKSELPEATPEIEPDETIGKLMEAILNKYPAHKRVLFLREKFLKDGLLNTTETSEVERFSVVLGISVNP